MSFTLSSFSMSYGPRQILSDLQTELVKRQSELSSGRKADIGLSLGAQTRQSISLSASFDLLQTHLASNQLITSRVDAAQTSLTSLIENSTALQKTLINSQPDGGGRGIIAEQAKTSLTLFISTLNGVSNNGYIFGGVKTDTAPLNNYFSNPASASKTAVDTVFSSAPPDGFGFSQSSPLVSTITSQQIEDFIDGPLTSVFSDTEWAANWSNASSQPVKNRIAPGNTIETSTTANDPALRKIAMAYVMMTDLGNDRLSPDAFKTLVSRAAETLTAGITELNSTRARVGVMQQNIKMANEAMQMQSNVIEIQIGRMEGIDQTEVAARINSLMTQIETSYSLTAKISQLSLVKYL